MDAPLLLTKTFTYLILGGISLSGLILAGVYHAYIKPKTFNDIEKCVKDQEAHCVDKFFDRDKGVTFEVELTGIKDDIKGLQKQSRETQKCVAQIHTNVQVLLERVKTYE